MNYEDYKVEELEDESVKKSNIAKTAGIAAGMGIIGAGAAVAATTLIDDEEEVPVVEETDITSDDLVGGASQGAQNTTINEKHVVGDDTKGEQNLTTDQTVAIVDEEGNLIASQTTGTIDGKAYVATDYNGDGMADEVFYDLNGDGVFTPNEGATLNGAEQFSMSNLGQASQTTVYVQGNEGGNGEEPLPGEDEERPDDTDIDDIHNDEDGQLNEGNEGEGDYADNNDDYNNDEDVSDFA